MRAGRGTDHWLSPFSRGDLILGEPDGLGQHREHRRHRVELCRHLRELGLGYPSLRDLRWGGPPKVMDGKRGTGSGDARAHGQLWWQCACVRGVSIRKQADVLSTAL